MTLFQRDSERRSVMTDVAHSEHRTDSVMIAVLALIFAPIIAMHIVFTFGGDSAAAEPLAAKPAAIEQPAR